MIPKIGPDNFIVRGISGVSLVAGALDDPPVAGSSVGPIQFRFPRHLFVSGFLIAPLSADSVDAAHLEIRIQDESFNDIIFDGQGGGFFAPSLLLHGFGSRVFDLQRPVATGDIWLISAQNTYVGGMGNPAITPIVSLFFDEGLSTPTTPLTTVGHR